MLALPDSKPVYCPRCDQPMTFHSAQSVEDKTMHVFECKNCDRLKAVEAPSDASAA